MVSHSTMAALASFTLDYASADWLPPTPPSPHPLQAVLDDLEDGNCGAGGASSSGAPQRMIVGTSQDEDMVAGACFGSLWGSHQLPADVFEHILECLEAKQANGSANGLASAPHQAAQQALRCARSVCRAWRDSIDAAVKHLAPAPYWSDAQNGAMFRRFAAAQSVGLVAAADGLITAMVPLHSLQRLAIESSSRLNDAGFIQLSNFTRLRELQLARHVAIAPPGFSGLLTYRNLPGSTFCSVGDSAIAAGLAPLTQLTVLNLAGCFTLSEAGLTVLHRLTQLQVLDLSGTAFGSSTPGHNGNAGVAAPAAPPADAAAARQLLEAAGLGCFASLPYLRSLSLQSCKHLRDSHVAGLAGLPTLTELNLGGCRGLTDASMAPLAALPRLAFLGLAGCHRITDRGMAALAAGTGLQASLTCLNVSGCCFLGDLGLAALLPLTALSRLGLAECKKVSVAGLLRVVPMRQLAALDSLKENCIMLACPCADGSQFYLTAGRAMG